MSESALSFPRAERGTEAHNVYGQVSVRLGVISSFYPPSSLLLSFVYWCCGYLAFLIHTLLVHIISVSVASGIEFQTGKNGVVGNLLYH